MLNLDKFITDCCAVLVDKASPFAVRDIVARAVSKLSAVLKALGEPPRSEIQTSHRSSDLTILNVIWDLQQGCGS